MALRPGRCYTRWERPYTRQSQKKPRKGYVKGVPASKIAQFEMGKKKAYNCRLFLSLNSNVQVRHNALEAARVMGVQALEKGLGKGAEYFFKIRVFPHHVLRENTLATGAGADRFQEGMRQSFGKPIGTAARVKAGQKIIEVQIDKSNLNIAKKALKKASSKLPSTSKITVEAL